LKSCIEGRNLAWRSIILEEERKWVLGCNQERKKRLFKNKFYEKVILSFWGVTRNIPGVIIKSLTFLA